MEIVEKGDHFFSHPADALGWTGCDEDASVAAEFRFGEEFGQVGGKAPYASKCRYCFDFLDQGVVCQVGKRELGDRFGLERSVDQYDGKLGASTRTDAESGDNNLGADRFARLRFESLEGDRGQIDALLGSPGDTTAPSKNCTSGGAEFGACRKEDPGPSLSLDRVRTAGTFVGHQPYACQRRAGVFRELTRIVEHRWIIRG
jgi:hypothetical protein